MFSTRKLVENNCGAGFSVAAGSPWPTSIVKVDLYINYHDDPMGRPAFNIDIELNVPMQCPLGMAFDAGFSQLTDCPVTVAIVHNLVVPRVHNRDELLVVLILYNLLIV